MTNLEYAAGKYSQFHEKRFLPAIEEAIKSGRLSGALADDLADALRISGSPGAPGNYGKAMINEVMLVMLAQMLPKPKAKAKK